jgi:hypothetical protein
MAGPRAIDTRGATIVTFVHLIQSASSLPTDASALESSISALERQITALESSSIPLERLLPLFTGLVALGVAMEFWVIWREYSYERGAWARGTICSPEKPSFTQFAVAVLSVLLITGGIVGELWVGIKITSINGVLRSKNAELRSDSDQLLALVTQRAGDAAESAKIAHAEANAVKGIADEARADAKDALKKAQTAQRELAHAEADAAKAQAAASRALSTADKAESHIADALQRAAKAEAELHRINTPRSLVHTDELIAALKPFNGTEYTLNVFQDEEAIELTRAVDGVLHQAGWVRKQPKGLRIGITAINVFSEDNKDTVEVCIETGIQIHAQVKETVEVLRLTQFSLLPKTVQAASTLRGALVSSVSPSDERNVGNSVLINNVPAEGPVFICVGKKP